MTLTVTDDWAALSVCQRQANPDRFFPENGRPPKSASEPCRSCPVQRECLEFALNGPWEPYGVWGGLPQKDVQQLWFQRHPGFRHDPDTSAYIRRYVT